MAATEGFHDAERHKSISVLRQLPQKKTRNSGLIIIMLIYAGVAKSAPGLL